MIKKKLLIVCHAPSPRIKQLADAVLKGAQSIEDTDSVMQSPFDTMAEDLIAADGIIFGTPENFGYMSGALKDLFDRTFHAIVAAEMHRGLERGDGGARPAGVGEDTLEELDLAERERPGTGRRWRRRVLDQAP